MIATALIESLCSITCETAVSRLELLTDRTVAWCEIISNLGRLGCFTIVFHSFYFLTERMNSSVRIYPILKQAALVSKALAWFSYYKIDTSDLLC